MLFFSILICVICDMEHGVFYVCVGVCISGLVIEIGNWWIDSRSNVSWIYIRWQMMLKFMLTTYTIDSNNSLNIS